MFTEAFLSVSATIVALELNTKAHSLCIRGAECHIPCNPNFPPLTLVGFLLSAENKLWFQPECTGTAEEGVLVGPSPRAFHVAVAVDCNMFIFGGRYGRKRFDPHPLLLVFVIPVWKRLHSLGASA